MDPIFNVRTKVKEIKVRNEPISSIWIEFDTYISNVTDEDIFKMYKFAIPFAEFDADAFEDAGGEIMNYMANDLFMGSQIFLGGYEIEDPPQEIDISSNIAQGTRRLIDMEVGGGYIYIYQFVYVYANSLYSFVVTNTVTQEKLSDDIQDERLLIAIRYRNQIRRGPIIDLRRNDDNFEVEQDLKILYNIQDDFKAEINLLKEDIELLPKLYDLEDRVGILLESVDLYGYGIGKYGRNGGYGL